MAKLTRLATTVTARYYSASDVTDAFYLDGRLSGKREARSADITVDKEDRGFFFSVFSHATVPGRDPAAEPAYAMPLKKLFNEIKTGRKALDDEIGELVNTAVAVTGRMKLQADNTRSPFFAGVMVKDTEAFAITMGKGLAFLYRDDTLFPLTATDLPIEAVNAQKQKVDNFYNYCATKTATALCSNIAQLKMDDCIILCNREIYDALGQHELLRILYEAEDQCDAAGIIITEAAAKVPGVPLQMMISFVEGVSAQEKSGLFGFGKKKRQQSYNEAEDDAIEVPIVSAAPVMTAAAAAVPVSGPAVPEPLFFGNEATDPFVQPLAEKPVAPSGPEDPIHFKDDEMAPFGEPVEDNSPHTDEGGFVKTEFDENDTIPSPDAKPADEAYPLDAYSDEGKSTPQYVPDEPEDEENEPLVFGDDTSPEKLKRQVAQSAAYAASSASQTPVQVPGYRPGTPYGQPPAESSGQGESSFFIPFESRETAAPKKTNVNDIPDMPIYDAPTYSPPTYPTNSYTPTGYDNAGVYARGSYSVDDEEDVRRDIPPQTKHSAGSYSYTPPQKTVPSYGGSVDPRMAQGQQQRPYQNVQQPSKPASNHPQRSSQDMFDQDQGFDYGQTDAAYKRNRFWMLALAAICLICFIVLLSVWLGSCHKNKPAESTPIPTSTTIAPTTAAPSGSDTTPTDTTLPVTPAVQPNGLFRFSDQTGFRTWWDLFHYAYNIELPSNTDARIAAIIAYNNLPSGYVPAPGDGILLPPVEALPTP